MSEEFKYISGRTDPVVTGPVPTATVIAIGDFVSEAPAPLTAAGDAPNFLGVSGQRSDAGDTFRLRVSTKGRYQHPVTPDTFEIGDMVAIAGPQLLVKTANAAQAIGRVARQYTTATSSVEWRIGSNVMADT